MQTTAWPAFKPDFFTSRKTMIASSTTAEIESATAVTSKYARTERDWGGQGPGRFGQWLHTHTPQRS
ncbi:hypothetical protein GCM10010361_25480 [Streptomyces olivaceiscleroticus]|uniref:Uncharacterized protein n=1 Tax=Streptomyces olivaceiscleroticus TaxID=68245 RepID=A0ABN0ZW34_9ACTN